MCKSYVRTMYGLSCHEHDQTSMGPEKVSTYYRNNFGVNFATSNWLVMLKRPLSPRDHFNHEHEALDYTGLLIFRVVADLQNSSISAKSCKIPQKTRNTAKSARNICKYVCVGKTYLILIMAIRPVLFTPNVQIYLQTSSLQRVNNVPKLPGVFRWMLQKTGH